VTDAEAYLAYPDDRWVYNKLALYERLGYECGPAGVGMPDHGEYIIKPIMNLDGMGRGARKVCVGGPVVHDDLRPGEFWCEWFYGKHLSTDLHRLGSGHWKVALRAEGTPSGCHRFTRWVRASGPGLTPIALQALRKATASILDDIKLAPVVNIESIGSRIIEVHLRGNPDFKSDDEVELIPVWSDSDRWEYRPDRDGARAGFMVRKQ
jgi:hypothetical protein